MPGTFAYVRSTLTLTVTGGTSGAPADFASLFAWDRATPLTLLAPVTPTSNTLALTYQIQPAQLLALLITFYVASKTAQTDYIYITGFDAWGVAQVESINVSAGNGTYVSTLRWGSITNLDCSDSPTGGGNVWADGTLQVDQPITGVTYAWNDQYGVVATNFYIGDGTTSTYFATNNESVYCSNYSSVKANATLKLGALGSDNRPLGGSRWSWYSVPPYQISQAGSNLEAYGSIIKQRRSGVSGRFYINGTLTADDSVFFGGGKTSLGEIFGLYAAANVRRCLFVNAYTLLIGVTPTEFADCYTGLAAGGLITFGLSATLRGARISAPISITLSSNPDTYIHLVDIDPALPYNQENNTIIGLASQAVYEEYSVKLTVIDQAGAAIEDATATCLYADDSVAFSVDTDSIGEIATQDVIRRKLYRTDLGAVVSQFYGPHRIVVSKPGYKTTLVQGIELIAPVDWKIKLPPIDYPPEVTSV